MERSRTVGDDRSPDEPFSRTVYFAALECMVDGDVHIRHGSNGGWLTGPRHYERAFWDTLDDFPAHGLDLDEATRRHAFRVGVCLAVSERVLNGTALPAS